SVFGDGWATARSLARLCKCRAGSGAGGLGLSGVAGGAPRWGAKQPAKQALGLRSTQAHAFVAHFRRPAGILGAHVATLWRWCHTDECALVVKPDAAGDPERPTLFGSAKLTLCARWCAPRASLSGSAASAS